MTLEDGRILYVPPVRLRCRRLGRCFAVARELMAGSGDKCVENPAPLGYKRSGRTRAQQQICSEVPALGSELDAAARPRPTFDRAGSDWKILGREAVWPRREHRTGQGVPPLDDHQPHSATPKPERLSFAAPWERDHAARCDDDPDERVCVWHRPRSDSRTEEVPARRYCDTDSRCADPMRTLTGAPCRACKTRRDERDERGDCDEASDEVTPQGFRSPHLYDSRSPASPPLAWASVLGNNP